jgi:Putative DNA-binding HTH domain
VGTLDAAKMSQIGVEHDFYLPGAEADAGEAATWATQRIITLIRVFEPTLRGRAADLRQKQWTTLDMTTVDDLRYTAGILNLADAARFLDVARQTFHRWARGYPVASR